MGIIKDLKKFAGIKGELGVLSEKLRFKRFNCKSGYNYINKGVECIIVSDKDYKKYIKKISPVIRDNAILNKYAFYRGFLIMNYEETK